MNGPDDTSHDHANAQDSSSSEEPRGDAAQPSGPATRQPAPSKGGRIAAFIAIGLLIGACTLVVILMLSHEDMVERRKKDAMLKPKVRIKVTKNPTTQPKGSTDAPKVHKVPVKPKPATPPTGKPSDAHPAPKDAKSP